MRKLEDITVGHKHRAQHLNHRFPNGLSDKISIQCQCIQYLYLKHDAVFKCQCTLPK